MTVAPPTLTALQAKLVHNLHTSNLGIVGDASHVRTGGYHIGAKSLRAAGMGGDYSLKFSLDSMSNTDYACAIDIGGSSDLLMELGTRLVHALKAHDPRVYGKIRATNAPWDGDSTDRRYDCESPSTTSDDNTQASSDRGHIHVEFYRTLVLNQAVMDGFYNVLAGVPLSAPKPPVKPPVTSAVLKPGSTGQAVKNVQSFFDRVFPSYRSVVSVNRGQLLVVDGIYGAATAAWVKVFQGRTNIPQTGNVDAVTAAKMKGYGYTP